MTGPSSPGAGDTRTPIRTPNPENGRLAVLVSGSGTNLRALIDTIEADPDFGGEIVVVASDDARAGGLDRAGQAGIPTVAVGFDDYGDRTEWEADLVEAIAAHDVDLVVFAGFMRLVSGDFLARWPDRVINLHPSLLPAFPGAHGVRDALDYGVKVTGATVHLVDEQVDHGPIIAQEPVAVHAGDDEATLHERIKTVEHRLLPAAVKLLCHERVVVEGRTTRITPARTAASLTEIDVEHEFESDVVEDQEVT